MKTLRMTLTFCTVLLSAQAVWATPSTTYWAPSTTYIQPFLVPHITYDTYFGTGTAPAAGPSPVYPIDTGLTIGILPFDKLNLEVGYDLLLPTSNPVQVFLNAKLGVPEDLAFKGMPSLAVGIFGVGFKKDVTAFNVLYGQIQKNLPWGGYVSVGGYYGAGTTTLWTNSDGKVVRGGFIGGLMSPDINTNLPGLKKIVVFGDVQTGKNAYGAGGPGIGLYFSDTIDLLTGPVFFFDKKLQPGGRSLLWTLQLDVDITLLEPPKPAAPAQPPAPEGGAAPQSPAAPPAPQPPGDAPHP